MKSPAPPSKFSPRLRLVLGFVIILGACLRASWSTLDRYFIGDDFGYVGRFHAFPFRDWPALFFHDWSGGMWGYVLPELRPFAALSFIIDGHLWGVNPLGYHLTNLVLDIGCACLVGLIVWRLHRAPLWTGAAAAVLFAWHPAHAEPVAWITGRVDLLSTLAYLAGFFAGARTLQTGERKWRFAAWVAYFVGCFSKEFCLTLPLVLLLWVAVYRPKHASGGRRGFALLFAGFVAIAGGFLLCRRFAFGPGSGGVETLSLFSAMYAERQLDYLRWFLPPLYHVGRDFRPQLVSIAAPLITTLALVSLAILALWRWKTPATSRWRALAFYGLLWYAVATLPLAAASYFSPRHLYLATAGLSISAGLLVASIASRRWLASGAVVIAAVYCLTRFDHAVTPWRHAAKLSERVTREVQRVATGLQTGEILLLEVPETFEGVWMWSWSVPFSLQPPFLPASPLPRVTLPRPATFYAPQFWSAQPALAALAEAPAARLLRADETGSITTHSLQPADFQLPARELQSAAPAGPDMAWKNFISSLPAR